MGASTHSGCHSIAFEGVVVDEGRVVVVDDGVAVVVVVDVVVAGARGCKGANED